MTFAWRVRRYLTFLLAVAVLLASAGVGLCADTVEEVYRSVQETAKDFPVQTPYVPVTVGTFDAATGSWSGYHTAYNKIVAESEPGRPVEYRYVPINVPKVTVDAVDVGADLQREEPSG